MGVWGTAVFPDDIAADARDALIDYLNGGLPVESATQELVNESAEIINDPNDSIVFWLALAAIQWQLGRLMDSVRDKAVQIIDSGADLRKWKDAGASPADVRRRSEEVAKLRSQLLGPQPEPRRLKRVEKSSTDFEQGDVFRFRLPERVSVRFCVLKICSDRGGDSAHLYVLGADNGERAEMGPISNSVLFSSHSGHPEVPTGR